MLVPILHHTADMEQIFVLNEIAYEVWNLLDQTRDKEQIESEIALKYEVAPQRLRSDLDGILSKFKEMKAVFAADKAASDGSSRRK